MRQRPLTATDFTSVFLCMRAPICLIWYDRGVESNWRFAAAHRPLLRARPPRWSLHLTIPMIQVACQNYHHHHCHLHYHLIADNYRRPISVLWSTNTMDHCVLTVWSPAVTVLCHQTWHLKPSTFCPEYVFVFCILLSEHRLFPYIRGLEF